MNTEKLSRRYFLKITPFALISLVPILRSGAWAQDHCPDKFPAGIKEIDPATSKRLDYVSDAKESKNTKYKAGQNCGNCKFYKLKSSKDGTAPCTMAGNKYVSVCGWCKSYKPTI